MNSSQLDPNELVSQINQEFVQCLDAIIVNPVKDSQIPKEEVNTHISNLFDCAKQLEHFFITVQYQHDKKGSKFEIQREIIQLEQELARKQVLIEKYSKKIMEWEKTFEEIQAAWQQ